jgi:hypothetical protein
VPSTQVSPAPQAGMQATTIRQVPPMQVWPAGQARPQPPQCIGSVLMLRQLIEQHISPGEHAGMHAAAGTHAPIMHISPAAQGVPHAPQFIASVCVLTQRPVQQLADPPHRPAAPQ